MLKAPMMDGGTSGDDGGERKGVKSHGSTLLYRVTLSSPGMEVSRKWRLHMTESPGM